VAVAQFEANNKLYGMEAQTLLTLLRMEEIKHLLLIFATLPDVFRGPDFSNSNFLLLHRHAF